MDEGKFAADFLSENFVKILKISNKVLGKVDEDLKIKLKSAYTKYLTRTAAKYSKSKSFFIRNDAVDLYEYYVPTGIFCGNKRIDTPSLKNIIEFSKHSVITGTGGCGKTVLMKHLFLDTIRDKSYAPILIELRDLNSEQESLEEYVLKTLDTFGFNISGSYVEKAKKEGHLCFFLDGYDEVKQILRKKLVKEIKLLSNKFPDCPIIISSRPDDDLDGINHFSTFSVMPLTLDTASSLIKKLPYDEKIKTNFGKALKNGMFFKHESFLSNPLLLSIMLLTYGENAEIPSKLSIFYNQAYEALFTRHDAYKEGFRRTRLTDLDILDFGRVFALFSLQTYQKSLIKMPKVTCLNFIEKSQKNLNKEINSEDYLKDLLSAACLLIEDGLEVAFSHKSFQEYFVAKYISEASPEKQEKLIGMYKQNIRSDKVINLLFEINPEIVEKFLFLPELEKVFNNIGVKRNVGISHLTKYIKYYYDTVNITPYELTLTKNKKPGSTYINELMFLFVKTSNSYEFPEAEHFDKVAKSLNDKYNGAKGEQKSFSTKELTYKSPLLVDLLEHKGRISLVYLQNTFAEYKKLKRKYDNELEDFDKLLMK